ncbi:metalloregulator ArsR/SmtB family transcription factor [Streptomyces sp. NPDC048290]|uniref:ArsR/SmtB family transcription factor n=1 Tax=Streptomyces sp. NPDC048290 TaxID=3155811 RepID=UPI0034303732
MDAQEPAWDTTAAERAVAVLKAVADPSRYRLLWALNGRELPVSELARLLGAHVAATSQHLAKLRAAGLVSTRREGTRIFYRADGVGPLLTEVQLMADSGTGPPAGGGPEPDGAGAAEPVRAPRTRGAARPVWEG